MADSTSRDDRESRARATALRHALDIEDRKKLQARIADLVVEAFDLPSKPDADPARPQPSDATLFKECLGLFQAADLDDLIYERNVDNRCGYALCPRPNQKLAHNGQKIWNRKGGKDFALIDKAEMEKWCSKSCRDRTMFVRAQLGTEPAWLREVQAVEVRLLEEFSPESLSDSFHALSLSKGTGEGLAGRLQALALERGEPHVAGNQEPVAIVENSSEYTPKPPQLEEQQDSVEGHHPRKVRFSKP
ncbi:hypothetical protein A1O3_07289 [Capronia epimyces CBS 606.96]|uniref:RNA polymerase II subunit B1 CTD phosphatase RPAP2 homolog n=1 Tax=Capronia epimyces CBS 606.96 TaxID=1182542 RepID=W9XVH8_9EURO|nr:uncharacterized protein A1O3_07289 [Capronia epimyces CBS 606.96]EXJ81001.1 hypothetical protein A1O3_07289 [Capronia epimyces CBS 606.96]